MFYVRLPLKLSNGPVTIVLDKWSEETHLAHQAPPQPGCRLDGHRGNFIDLSLASEGASTSVPIPPLPPAAPVDWVEVMTPRMASIAGCVHYAGRRSTLWVLSIMLRHQGGTAQRFRMESTPLIKDNKQKH